MTSTPTHLRVHPGRRALPERCALPRKPRFDPVIEANLALPREKLRKEGLKEGERGRAEEGREGEARVRRTLLLLRLLRLLMLRLRPVEVCEAQRPRADAPEEGEEVRRVVGEGVRRQAETREGEARGRRRALQLRLRRAGGGADGGEIGEALRHEDAPRRAGGADFLPVVEVLRAWDAAAACVGPHQCDERNQTSGDMATETATKRRVSGGVSPRRDRRLQTPAAQNPRCAQQ